MENEFLTFELSLILKELGFDEPCFARYRKKLFQLNTLGKPSNHNSEQIVKGDVSAPLWQQAFDFIRKKYNKVAEITHTNKPIEGKWCFDITNYPIGYLTWFDPKTDKYYETYEEARKEALVKLIDIINNK